MESRSNNETSVQIRYEGRDLDSTRDETGDLPLEQRPHNHPITSAIRDFPLFCYFLPHHDPVHWPQAKSILEPIAQGLGGLKGFIDGIRYFVNAENHQIDFTLQKFFEDLTELQQVFYIDEIFPGIAKLILETESLFPDKKSLPILRQHSKMRIVLSKKQCACLLAHMVMCTTCGQDNEQLGKLINFSLFYDQPSKPKVGRRIQKIKCIFTYFEEFFRGFQEGEVIFERSFLEGDHNEEQWKDYDKILKAEVQSKGGIEDTENTLQVVFSDKKLGEILKLQTTQQQIMSLIHPELILSVLFCEELQSDEALRVYGAGRYSNYKGYGDSFEFSGSYQDGVNKRQHVMMDAEKYIEKQATFQFQMTYVLRELNKAHAGFLTEDETPRKVATGKWGCGVCKGNPQLKFIIQWLAASIAGREIVFYTDKDDNNFNIDDVTKILEYYQGKKVGELFKDLEKATREMQSVKYNEKYEEIHDENKNLFRVLINQFDL